MEDPNFPGFCNGTNDMIYVGDFDADGRKDLVCRMNHGNKYCIALTGTVFSTLAVECFDCPKIRLFKVDKLSLWE